MRKSYFYFALGAMVGLSSASAQSMDYSVLGGGVRDNPGDLVGGPIDMEGQTGSNGHLGIQYLGDNYFGSARVITTVGTLRANQLYRFDSAGTLTGQVDQVPGAFDDAWGYRDGASDGTFLYFGWGGGVARHNADGTGGTQIIAGAAPGGVGTWRALAYDADLDGGAGGLWVQSFGTSLITTTMSGTLINDFGNASATSLYGLALADGRLFGHHTGGDIVEINRNDGTLMGTVFNVSSSFTLFSAQGGLSEVPGGGFGSGNAWDLAAVSQGTPDEFAVFELVPAPGSLALLAMGGLLITRRRR